MKLFGSYTYTWWQMGVFKLSLLAIGMIGGAFLASFVMSSLWVFVVIAALASGYIIAASFSGANKR
jgi:uncharacterized membrane protein